MDDEVKCIQTLEEHDQFLGDFQNRLKTVKILRIRKPLDTSPIIMMDFCKAAQTSNETQNCTEAEIYHCTDRISQRTCKQDTNLTHSTEPEFGENLISNELSIQIHHNFTNILNVTVFFVYHEFNSENLMAHIVQKISVEYLELNETFATRDAHQVSGNIGYLLHKPVIFTKYIRENASSNENTAQASAPILAYFHNETNCTNDGHYLKLPAVEASGDCVINNFTFQTINFGEKSRTKCNVLLTPTDFNETDTSDHSTMNFEQNNTHICRTFQKKIFDYLMYGFELENANSTIYHRFNIYVSELGNPRNNSHYWHDFRMLRPVNMDEIVAKNGVNSALEFTCMNMILGIRYEFFYGTMLVGKIPNQALIKVAQIQFCNRVNLKFKLDEDVLKVPIYIDVMFYDFSRIVGNRAHISAQPTHIFILFILSAFLRFIWWN